MDMVLPQSSTSVLNIKLGNAVVTSLQIQIDIVNQKVKAILNGRVHLRKREGFGTLGKEESYSSTSWDA